MGIVNWRILSAWPNWFLIPLMLAFWVVAIVLAGELLGADSYRNQAPKLQSKGMTGQ